MHFVVYNMGMKEKKYFIDAVIQKEKERNQRMLIEYKNRLSNLPKGSLLVRELNGKQYCYLRYREGKRVIQKYAGTVDQADVLQKQIEERNHLHKLINMLEEENKRILKMEAIK